MLNIHWTAKKENRCLELLILMILFAHLTDVSSSVVTGTMVLRSHRYEVLKMKDACTMLSMEQLHGLCETSKAVPVLEPCLLSVIQSVFKAWQNLPNTASLKAKRD